MDYIVQSHRHGLTLFQNEEPFRTLWAEVDAALHAITDDALVECFQSRYVGYKSISAAVNTLVHDELVNRGWQPESPIFADETFAAGDRGRFRLDFAKDVVSVEVAFNHGEAAAWNLLKPVLASELNHVRKDIQTEAGIIITATEEMKLRGGFDSAVGTFEKYAEYLRPLNDVLTVPLVLIGLKAPDTFEIVHLKDGIRQRGQVTRL